MYYTIGQRRGLDIGGTKERLFVVGKDLDKNVLYVAEGENNEFLYSDSATVSALNFNVSDRPTEALAKFRYRAADYPVKIEYLDDGELRLSYDSVKAVTPGQAVVFYLDEQCIGGGIIKEVSKKGKKLWYLL